jgi:hypothetical protein
MLRFRTEALCRLTSHRFPEWEKTPRRPAFAGRHVITSKPQTARVTTDTISATNAGNSAVPRAYNLYRWRNANRETSMHRFSPLLFAIVISAPLLAQSRFDKSQTLDLIKITKYCATTEDYSDSQVSRMFAPITSVFGQSTGWVEFHTRADWIRAGSPKPVALVWYRHAKIVRVAISPNGDESPRVYAEYCYRQDGTLARLRSVPRERQKCEPNRNQCSSVLREERFYPSEGSVLTTYVAVDGLLDIVNGTTGTILEAPPAERMVSTFVPMKWREYLHVTDLPFNTLLLRNALR